jgi:hemolysin activation/secretion protein
MAWPLHLHSRSRPARTERRIALLAGLCLIWLLSIGVAESAAQVLLFPEDMPPTVFPVSSLDLTYTSAHPDQPSPGALLPIEVELRKTERGWATPIEGESHQTHLICGADSPTIALEASGLARVLRAVVSKLHEQGIYGVDVRPAASEIDLEHEEDLRPADRTSLMLVVTVGRITQVRTIAGGDRIKSDWKIDNDLHARIREDSPLQATGVDDATPNDLLDRRALEDYLYRLNRYGGRRVEAALSPGAEPGSIVLDYRVLESKPWYVYAQVANTGTERTEPWQTRLGVSHRQLTDSDDSLTIEYLNSGLEDVNALSARYQAPFFRSERPEWMNRRKGEPGWFNWLPREKIPWWGVDRLRWEVDFSWGKSRAGDDPAFEDILNDVVTSSQFQYAGRFIYEAWQYRDFFVDVWGGLRLRDVRVRNRNASGANVGEAVFVMPAFGIHAERINQLSTLGIDISIQASISGVNESDLDGLGRDETDDKFEILDFNLGYSTFLEPLLFPNAWRNPATELTSTLAHEIALGVRGQYAFDYRLVPQASRTVGGLHSVRGYDQSVAVGDTIIVGSFEYRFHLPRALPVVRKPLQIPLLGDFRAAPQQIYGRPDWDLTFRAFVDVGRAIRNDGSPNGASAFEFNQTLIGAGVGAELQIKSNFRARIDWATALKDTNGNISNPSETGDDEIYVLFSILY